MDGFIERASYILEPILPFVVPVLKFVWLILVLLWNLLTWLVGLAEKALDAMTFTGLLLLVALYLLLRINERLGQMADQLPTSFSMNHIEERLDRLGSLDDKIAVLDRVEARLEQEHF